MERSDVSPFRGDWALNSDHSVALWRPKGKEWRRKEEARTQCQKQKVGKKEMSEDEKKEASEAAEGPSPQMAQKGSENGQVPSKQNGEMPSPQNGEVPSPSPPPKKEGRVITSLSKVDAEAPVVTESSSSSETSSNANEFAGLATIPPLSWRNLSAIMTRSIENLFYR